MFRTSEERKGEKERVRAALLRAALRLAAVHGFASLGLREVSREAGIAPTSFYRHFADMPELGLALCQELVGEAITSVCEALRTADGPAPAVVWDALQRACTGDPELMRFFVAERVGASASLRASLQEQLASLAAALRAATASDSSEPLPLAAADSAVLIVLDACVRTLDETQDSAALRESCVWSMGSLLAAPAHTPNSKVKL